MSRRLIPLLSSALICSAVLATPIAASAAVVAGQAAPAFSLPMQDGKPLNLADFRGRVVYLDFWASWCGPCRQSFPWMNELLARFKSRGLEVLAVNVDARRDDAQSFLLKIPASFPVLFDPQGSVPTIYGLKGMPTSYLIGRDGAVQMVHASFKESDRAALEARIEAELDKAAP